MFHLSCVSRGSLLSNLVCRTILTKNINKYFIKGKLRNAVLALCEEVLVKVLDHLARREPWRLSYGSDISDCFHIDSRIMTVELCVYIKERPANHRGAAM